MKYFFKNVIIYKYLQNNLSTDKKKEKKQKAQMMMIMIKKMINSVEKILN